MAERTNSNAKWIEDGFINSPEVETVHQYQEMVEQRKATLSENLPSDALAFRKEARTSLGFSDEDTVVFFGEQSTGLNEPPLVAGKRLLFAHGQSKYGWKGLEINASSDVVKTEKGYYRAVLPNTQDPKGFSELQLLSLKRYSDSPACFVKSEAVDIKKMEASLRASYPFKHSPTEAQAKEFMSAFSEHDIYSDVQKALLKSLLENVGIAYEATQIEDFAFETSLVRMNALGVLMSRWEQITKTADGENHLATVKVPDSNTLPFFVIDPSDATRASVVGVGSPGLYHLVHPKNPEIVFTKEPLKIDDILEKYPIAFRAVPRILLYSLITDGQITGGGALYNIPSAETFKKIFDTEYFPQVWMDVQTDGKGLFQYQSLATYRRESRSGYIPAEKLISSGHAAMIDLFISHPDYAKEIVSSLIEKSDMETKDRVNLKNH